MNEWCGRILAKIDKSAPIVACQLWSQWSTKSSVALWLNKCGAMRLTSFGHSLLKILTLTHGIFFQWCGASLINLLANHWNLSVVFSSSWAMVLCGLFGFNGKIYFLMLFNGWWRKHIELRGIPHMTMIDLSGDKLSRIRKKPPNIAYEDVLKEFDNVWYFKGLIV